MKMKKEKELTIMAGDVFKYIDEVKNENTFPICLNITGFRNGSYMEINEKMFNDIKNRGAYTSLYVKSMIVHKGKIHLDLTDNKRAKVNIPNLGQFTETVKQAVDKKVNLEESEKRAVLNAVVEARMSQLSA